MFLINNLWIFFLLCVIPILQVFLHCIYYGRYPDTLHIAIYNQETNCTHNPCEYIEKCSYYSCHFLHFFHNTTNFKLDYYESEISAKNSNPNISTLGFIKIPKHYTESITKNIIHNSLKNLKNQKSLSESEIYIEIDMTNFDFGRYLKINVLNIHNSYLLNIYNNFNLSNKYATYKPLKIYEFKNLHLTENIISEIISCAIFLSAMFYSALLLQNEVKNGYLTRNIIAGVTILEILLSFLSVQIIFSIIQAFCLFLLVEILLVITWESSLLLIVLINISTSICGMSIGLLIGSFTSSSNQLFVVTLIVYFINIIMSGIFWPYENIIFNLENAVIVLPLPMPVKAVKSVLIQGRKLNSKNILYAVNTIVVWTFISFRIFIYRLKTKH